MEPQLLTVIDKEDLKQWAPSEWMNWQFEAKHDGARCLIVNGVPQSRAGKPLNNLGAVLKELGNRAAGCVLDGEIVGESWADTMHNARASEGKRNENALTFRPFDMLTIAEWKHQKCDRDLADRQNLLWSYLKNSDHVSVVNHFEILDYSQFEVFYLACLESGCDGVVLKLKHSMYEFKRTKTWLKVKPEHTVDGEVVATRVGKLKYAGTLGALVFKPEGSTVITNVSGMTDAQRNAWWKTPKLIVGKMIEVKCRGVHSTGKLIEPRFVRIREDK
jgi:ATP-dependent DNA ligase